MSTQTVVLIGVVLYLALMLVIGFIAARRSDTAENFIVAGRRMPLFLCAATVMATWFGGGTMMGAAGAAYEEGLLGVIADPFGGALALFMVGFLFARVFRRMGLLTVIDFIESRFGRVAASVVTLGIIVSNVGWTGGLIVAFGFVFKSLTGLPVEIGIFAGAIVVMTYTTVGGLWAVAATDFVQMIIITAGLLLLLWVVWVDIGGWGAIAGQLPEHTFRMIPLEHTATGWLDYLRLWFIFGLADVSSQTLAQRAFAARDEQVAQNSFYLASALYLLVGLVAVFLGIVASVTLPGLEDPEAVIPTLALEHLSPVAIAFFVGALLSAIMSSADSSLLACASLVGENVLPWFKPGASDRHKLIATRIAIPAFGFLAMYVALKVQVIFDLIIDANSVVLVSVVVPFIAGIYYKGCNRTAALAAMAAGFLAWLVALLLLPEWPGDMLGLGACAVTLLIVAPLTRRLDPPRPLTDMHGQPLEAKDRLGTLPLFRRVRP